MTKKKKPKHNAHGKSPLLSAVLLIALLTLPAFSFQEEICGVVSGQVVDKVTGNGVSGVVISVNSGAGRHEAISDENGEFIINEVTRGRLSVSFLPPEPYAIGALHELSEKFKFEKGQNLHIIKRLSCGGTIAGRIFNVRSGQGIREEDIYHLRVMDQLVHTFELDADGNYKLSQLKPGVHDKVIVSVKGFGIREFKNVEVRPNETTTVDIPFDPLAPAKVVGTVICKESGKALEAVFVDLYGLGYGFASHAYTNTQGVFEFHDVKQGDYEIMINGKKMTGSSEDVIKTQEISVSQELSYEVFFEVKECGLDYTDSGVVLI